MENPEKIEIEGLKTIHKLCKFGADHNMEGCTFTEIVERMFDDLAKAQAVPECKWTQNEDGYFDASCGQSFVFSEPEDKPSCHEFTHCCFCGGKLVEAQEPAND